MNDPILHFLRENALFLIVLVALVGGFLFLRTPGTDLASDDELAALTLSGQPIVLEFYSNT